MSKCKGKPDPVLASSLLTKKVTWAVEGFCACTKVTVVATDAGGGGSLFAADLIARVSTGTEYPIEFGAVTTGNVLFLSDDSEVSERIAPRLMAAGADRDKIHFVGITEFADAKLLEGVLTSLPMISLMVLDMKVDAASEVAIEFIEFLRRFAEEKELAVLFVVGPTSGAKLNTKQMSALLRSKASVVAALRRAEGSARIVVPIKNTLGTDTEAFAFTVTQVAVQDGISAPRLEWESSVPASAVRNASGTAYSKRRLAAKTFSEKHVVDGALTQEVAAKAIEEGISVDLVAQEAAKSGFIRKREGGIADAGYGVWRKLKSKPASKSLW